MTERNELFAAAQARAVSAAERRDWPSAAHWSERAWRLSGYQAKPGLELASVLVRLGDHRAIGLLQEAAKTDPAAPIRLALVAALRHAGRHQHAASVMAHCLASTAVDAIGPTAHLAAPLAQCLGLPGWLGWGGGRLLLGAAPGADIHPADLVIRAGRAVLALHWRCDGPGLWSAPFALNRSAPSVLIRCSPELLGSKLRPGRIAAVDGAVEWTADGLRGWAHHPGNPSQHPRLLLEIHKHGHVTTCEFEPAETEPAGPSLPLTTRRSFAIPVPPGAESIRVRAAATGRDLAGSPASPPIRPLHSTGAPPGPPLPSAALAALDGRRPTLLITHDEGGGVERHVGERAARLRRAGRAALLLRSQHRDPATVSLELPGSPLQARFRLPEDAPALSDALRQCGPADIEIHHLRLHPPAVRELVASLGLPYDVVLHDYALICPRVTLVAENGRYCGEPGPQHCEPCAASYPGLVPAAPAGVAALRRETARLLAGARSVIAPSQDVARRFARHFPALAAQVRPWERALHGRAAGPTPRGRPGSVCVVGSINRAKGFDILLACARDAAARALPLRFTVIGHTSGDAALIEAGVFVTGPYREHERAQLIARHQPTAGFLPSIWPEPWCYALTGLLQARLPVLCFDIGAQAERVRKAGGVVAPLTTSAAELNQHLLRMMDSLPQSGALQRMPKIG